MCPNKRWSSRAKTSPKVAQKGTMALPAAPHAPAHHLAAGRKLLDMPSRGLRCRTTQCPSFCFLYLTLTRTLFPLPCVFALRAARTFSSTQSILVFV